MSDPTKVSADANVSDANSATANVADAGLSDDELNAVNGGWGVVSTSPRSLGKEKGAGLMDQMAEREKNRD